MVSAIEKDKPFYIPQDIWVFIEFELKNGFSHYKEPEKIRSEKAVNKLFNSIIFNSEQEHEVKQLWKLLSQSSDCLLLYGIIRRLYTMNFKVILDYYKQSKERSILDKKIKSLAKELKKPTYIANIPDVIDAQVTKNGEVFPFLAYLEHARAQINQSEVGVHGSAYESFNKAIEKAREPNHLHFFIRSFAFELAKNRKEGRLLDVDKKAMKKILSLCLPLLFSDTSKKQNKKEPIDDWNRVIADTLRGYKIDW
jgi:hypothetical protein